MKKGISILLVLLCLLVNTIYVRPVIAEESPSEDEAISETLPETENEEVSGQEEVIVDEEEVTETEVLPEEPSENEEEQIEEPSETPIGVFELPNKDEDEITDEGFSFEIPESFVLRDKDVHAKKVLKEEDVLETLKDLEEGVDYAKGQMYFLADTLEYAQTVAEIYHCDLKSFSDGVAVILIKDENVTVYDLYEAAINDPDLPIIAPDYIVRIEPVKGQPAAGIESDSDLPDPYDWDDWVNYCFDDPDPFLTSPGSDSFQWQHEMINTYAGWNATLGDPTIRVAVIDYSVNPDHEEFVGRIQVEDIGCGTYYGGGHGNHVAGIIAAAVDNGAGGAGVAPNVELISLNVFKDNDEAYTSDIIEAIDRAVECGADIINMSIGGYNYESDYDFAVNRAYRNGVVIVAAAGNEGRALKEYPAAFDHTVAVASVGRNGKRAEYSNYGSWITISAPGSDIYSACTTSNDPTNNSAYDWMSGTSMAAPVVSGAIALYMSKVGSLNYDQILPVLKNSANKCSSSQMGYGIISVEKMFNANIPAPGIIVWDQNGEEVQDLKTNLPEGSVIELTNPISDPWGMVLYTVDGKKPTIKNGEIVNGQLYYDHIRVDDFEKGKTITLQAVCLNELGAIGGVKKITFKTPAIKAAVNKIKTVALDQTKVTLNLHNEAGSSVKLNAAQLIDVNSIAHDLDEVDHIWVSSNPKVATVDEFGYVDAKGKGTAKITLKIQDGSKKTAVCNITVIQLVDALDIKGQDAIVPGGTASYSVTAYPANANNKKVTWSLDSDYPEIKISAAGKVSIPKDIPYGTTFEICATAIDAGGVSERKVIEIVPKASSIYIDTDDPRAVYSKGKLSSVSMFTVDLKDDEHPLVDNELCLNRYIEGNDISPVWNSSNPKIATVDEDGIVTALKAGKTTITCTTNDGSKLKAKVTVDVKVPVSSIHLDFGNYYCVSLGKKLSLKDKVNYGSFYGTPTTKKVNWSISEVFYILDDEYYNITEDVKNEIKIVSNSTLSVASKIGGGMIDPSRGTLRVALTATAADGTGYSDFQIVTITPKINYMYFEYKSYYGYVDDGYQYIWFYCDSPISFDVKSSNAKVCNVWLDGYDGNWYCVGMVPSKKGTVTITAKALDGSGKTCKTSIRFY